MWLGLVSGLIVFIVAITGCVYVFQKEISEAWHHRVYFVQAPGSGNVPLSQMMATAQKELGADKPLEFITTYRDPRRTWEFTTYKEGRKDAITYFSSLLYYKSVYIDPHTGHVAGVLDHKMAFFSIVKYLHWSLLLNTPYGQPIVGYATLVFVLMLITGLIMWWPRKWNKANVQQRFKVKWKAGFKRVNYDLHNVPGFYVVLLALIISITGLVWAFSWVQAAVYVVASGSTKPPATVITESHPGAGDTHTATDIAFAAAWKASPDAKRMGVDVPKEPKEALSIFAYRGEETYYNFDELRFDQYSGRLLATIAYRHKNRGEKLIGMNYDIHTGAILGLPGKILAFIASLVAASLPVTGTVIYIGRRKKKKYAGPAGKTKVSANV